MDNSTQHADDGALSASMSWTSGALAKALSATLVGPDDIAVARLGSLENADGATLTFIRDARHAQRWSASKARCAIVSHGAEPADHDPCARALLIVDDADNALIRLLESVTPPHIAPLRGVHTGATIDQSAHVAPDAMIGPNVVVGPGSRVGSLTALHANVTLGANVSVGERCDIRAGVVIEDRCTVADGVIIHANSVVGADGFGYRPGPAGPVKIPHAGNVVIESGVELGACVTIDRGKFGSTRIGENAKIDNHVQIGHNCDIGRGAILCGACGLSGSVRVGDGATLSGGVGVKDNITIGAGATIGARSGVMDNIPPNEVWLGYPARPARQTMRIISVESRLPELASTVKRLSKDARAEAAQSAAVEAQA